jgi:hypothetical protein
MTHLTRSQLDELLQGLRDQAARFAQELPAADLADAIAGEAEALEHRIAANDADYFHNEVVAIMHAVGAVATEEGHE